MISWIAVGIYRCYSGMINEKYTMYYNDEIQYENTN